MKCFPPRRLLTSLSLCCITVGLAAACQQQPERQKVEYVTNAGWEAALTDLKSGKGDRDKVVQGCVLEFYARFDDKPSELPLRQTIAGLLDVSIGSTFKVFCEAYVEAVVEDRLILEDYDLFLEEAAAPRGGDLGRVSHEIRETHQELKRIRAEKAAQS